MLTKIVRSPFHHHFRLTKCWTASNPCVRFSCPAGSVERSRWDEECGTFVLQWKGPTCFRSRMVRICPAQIPRLEWFSHRPKLECCIYTVIRVWVEHWLNFDEKIQILKNHPKFGKFVKHAEKAKIFKYFANWTKQKILNFQKASQKNF
jgi:hypothetical protein